MKAKHKAIVTVAVIVFAYIAVTGLLAELVADSNNEKAFLHVLLILLPSSIYREYKHIKRKTWNTD